MNIEIRALGYADAVKIAEIERECFSLPWSEAAIRAEIERGLFLGAFSDGTLAGYIGASFVLDECEIYNVAVSERFRGNGIGYAVVSALIEAARERGAGVIMLEVRRSNIPAISLYEKAGFRKVGERKNFYEKPREDAVLYTFSF